MKIKIEWLYDEYDCDDCGISIAEGALVEFDDDRRLHLKPVAHCFGGKNWDQADVYKEILKELGHELKF